MSFAQSASTNLAYMTNKIEASNGRGERGAAQGWIRDLGLDGALDEEPQPRPGKNEEPQ